MKQNLLKPTYLKQLCTEYGFSPSKKYGQNYLISDAPIKKMIASADIRSGDTVIEIGPGFGVLTFALADVGAQVVAFEIERKLQRYWDEHKTNNIKIIFYPQGIPLREQLSIFKTVQGGR
jgi:protein-L-isoaspartate O-methyltransferase